jgi:hypothetical protein
VARIACLNKSVYPSEQWGYLLTWMWKVYISKLARCRLYADASCGYSQYLRASGNLEYTYINGLYGHNLFSSYNIVQYAITVNCLRSCVVKLRKRRNYEQGTHKTIYSFVRIFPGFRSDRFTSDVRKEPCWHEWWQVIKIYSDRMDSNMGNAHQISWKKDKFTHNYQRLERASSHSSQLPGFDPRAVNR